MGIGQARVDGNCAGISNLHIQTKDCPHRENRWYHMKLPHPVLSAIKLCEIGTSFTTVCASIAIWTRWTPPKERQSLQMRRISLYLQLYPGIQQMNCWRKRIATWPAMNCSTAISTARTLCPHFRWTFSENPTPLAVMCKKRTGCSGTYLMLFCLSRKS